MIRRLQSANDFDSAATWLCRTAAVTAIVVLAGTWPAGRERLSAAKAAYTTASIATNEADELAHGLWLLKGTETEVEDQLGSTVALFGGTAVVGVPGRFAWHATPTGASFTRTGVAFVLAWTGSGYAVEARLDSPFGRPVALSQPFGRSVAVSEDVVLVGAHGQVAVYSRQASGWAFVDRLAPPPGEPVGDFGATIVVDADIAVVGAPSSRGPGAVYVFRRNSEGGWAFANRVGPPPGASPAFASTLAVSRERVLVGDVGYVIDDGPRGAGYLYDLTGATPSPPLILRPWSGEPSGRFGVGVALSGDTVVIGAPNNEGFGGGAAYVFVERNGSWASEARLVSSRSPCCGTMFGTAISLDADVLAIGDWFDESDALGNYGTQERRFRSGAVHLFYRRNARWTQVDLLKAPAIDEDDRFGTSVAISGDRVIVGAPLDDSAEVGAATGPAGNGRVNAGAAYVFHRRVGAPVVPESEWATTTSPADRQGAALAVDGEWAAVGAPAGRDSRGGVHIVHRSPEHWSESAKLSPPSFPDGRHTSEFGAAVAMSGDTLVVGAPGSDRQDGDDFGLVYVFQRTAGLWSLSSTLAAPNAGARDRFGAAVATDGQTIVVGAPGEGSNARFVDGDWSNDRSPGAGAVYVFGRSSGGWGLEAYLKAADTPSSAPSWAALFALRYSFGRSVSVSGGVTAVGSACASGCTTTIFQRVGAAWTFAKANHADTRTTMEDIAVAASGTRVASVGVHSTVAEAGKSSWSVLAEVDRVGGRAVALRGGTLAVARGSVAIYSFSAGGWRRTATRSGYGGSQSVALSDTALLLGASRGEPIVAYTIVPEAPFVSRIRQDGAKLLIDFDVERAFDRCECSTDDGASWFPCNHAGSTATIGTDGAPRRYRVRLRLVREGIGGVASNRRDVTLRSVIASPALLRFVATKDGATGPLAAVTPAQSVTVTTSRGGSVSWTASADQPWIQLSAANGIGTGSFSVAVINPGNVIGEQTNLVGTVTIADPNTVQPATVVVQLTVTHVGQGSHTAGTGPPIGQVDTPVQTAIGLQGAIAMTGWVVDDVGVQHVRIYRQCLSVESAPAPVPAVAPCQDVLGLRVVLVGEASIISGARPDVEALFPTMPANNSAGWGFLILSNLLPNIPANNVSGGGVGTFQLYAIATDVEGHQKLLGRSYTDTAPQPTTVTVSNDTIAKPFGAIDTPGQGATVSGALNNFGWVLTPDSNTIADGTDILMPTTGTTIAVIVDGASVGTATYNLCRGTVGNPVPSGTLCDDDVSSIFRDAGVYRNLDAGRGAIGLRTITTTGLSNGLHTIQWGVTDSAGRSEGIGSRYFTVLNSAVDGGALRDSGTSGPRDSGTSGLRDPGTAALRRPGTSAPLFGRTGFDFARAFVALGEIDGVPTIRVPEMGRVELQVAGAESVALVANGSLREAPVGLSVDAATGTIAWSVGPGYLGRYRLEVSGAGGRASGARVIDVIVEPRGVSDEPLRMHLDHAQVGGPGLSSSTWLGAGQRFVRVEGWALDPQAETGSGVGAVHVWARFRGPAVPGSRGAGVPESRDPEVPESRGPEVPKFLGVAELGISRPDVAAAHGAPFDRAGFRFDGTLPGAGEWEIIAYVWNVRTQRFEDARSVVMTVK